MRHEARSEHGFSGAQVQPLLANLEGYFTLHDVEPFLLTQMHVQGRSAGHEVHVLQDEEAAAGFTAGDFEEDRAEP